MRRAWGAERLDPRSLMDGAAGYLVQGELVELTNQRAVELGAPPEVIKPLDEFGKPAVMSYGPHVVGVDNPDSVGGGYVRLTHPQSAQGVSSLLWENHGEAADGDGAVFALLRPASTAGGHDAGAVRFDGTRWAAALTITDPNAPENPGTVTLRGEVSGVINRSKAALVIRPQEPAEAVALVNGTPIKVTVRAVQAPSLIPGQADGRPSAFFPGRLAATLAPLAIDRVDLAPPPAEVDEAAGVLTLTVRRTGTAPGPRSVRWQAEGSRLGTTSGTITFADGQAEQAFTLPIVNDNRREADGPIAITLIEPEYGLNLGAATSAVVTVRDDDPNPRLAVLDAEANEGTELGFVVRLGGSAAGPVRVDYATGDLDARAGQDYDRSEGTITFGPGEVEHRVAVATRNDAEPRGDRSLQLRLTRADGADFDRAEANGRIIEDDTGLAPTLTPTLAPAPEPEPKPVPAPMPVTPPAPPVPASVVSLVVTNALDGGPGSLRQAIQDANNRPGHDLISFALPADGPQTIAILSELPTIVDPVTIDAGDPRLVLDGSGAAPGANGLVVTGGKSTIRGITVVNFPGHGVVFRGEGGNRLEGSRIGVDPTGTQAMGNRLDGVLIEDSANHQIGGFEADDWNVISANGTGRAAAGVNIRGAKAMNNRVVGNRIGTDATGATAIGNSAYGVFLGFKASGNVITGNLIAGNGSKRLPGADLFFSGRSLDGRPLNLANVAANALSGNVIGTDLTATTRLSGDRPDVVVDLPRASTPTGSVATPAQVVR